MPEQRAGPAQVNGETILRDAQLVTFSTLGTRVRIEASSDAKLLLLAGEPMDEPMLGFRPFVMNSQQEIRQAIADFNSDKFGRISQARSPKVT